MLFGHGLCSSCLFYVLYVLYERFFSRRLFVLKGVLCYMPFLGFWWFVFCVLNFLQPKRFGFDITVSIE